MPVLQGICMWMKWVQNESLLNHVSYCLSEFFYVEVESHVNVRVLGAQLSMRISLGKKMRVH